MSSTSSDKNILIQDVQYVPRFIVHLIVVLCKICYNANF